VPYFRGMLEVETVVRGLQRMHVVRNANFENSFSCASSGLEWPFWQHHVLPFAS
jgi:hypothetical protein